MKYFKRIITFSIALIMAICMMPIFLLPINAEEYGDKKHEILIEIENGVATSDDSSVGWTYSNNVLTLEHGHTFEVVDIDNNPNLLVDNHGVLLDYYPNGGDIINEADGVGVSWYVLGHNVTNYGLIDKSDFYDKGKSVRLENHGTIKGDNICMPITNYAGGLIGSEVNFEDGYYVEGNAGMIRCSITHNSPYPADLPDSYIDVPTNGTLEEPKFGTEEYKVAYWVNNAYGDHNKVTFPTTVNRPMKLYATWAKMVQLSVDTEAAIDADHLTRKFSAGVYPGIEAEQKLQWTVEGANNPETTIDSDGKLTVSPEETAASIKVRATSIVNPSKTGTMTLNIALPRITTAEVLPTATVNEPYRLKLAFSGDAKNYTMAPQDSQLPEGLTLDADGTIHGTIAKTGTYKVFTAGSVTYNAGGYNEKTQNISGTFTLAVKEKQSFDTSSFQDVNKYTFAKSFTQTVTGPTDGGAVTYSSSNENVAKVDSTTGEVTVVNEGTAVITANAAETDEYLPASASYKVTIDRAPTPNTSKGVLNGDNQTLNTKELPTEGMTVRYDMPMKEVVKVTLDNKELTLNKDFTMWSGSTFIKLTPAFLATLPEGEHTLAIFSDHDYKSSNFTLTAPAVEPKKEDTGRGDVITPKTSTDVANTESVSDTTTPKTSTAVNTGDQTNVLLYTVLLLLSVAAVIGVRKIYKKNI